MNPYTKELEALDHKRGHVHTLDDYRRAGEKAAADLTDDDLVIIEGFGGAKAAGDARARRELARNGPAPAKSAKRKPEDRLVTLGFLEKAFVAFIEGTLTECFRASEQRIVTASAPLFDGLFAKYVELHQRLAKFEARDAETKAKRHVKFLGQWTPGTWHAIGDAVVHQNQLWACVSPTAGEPGVDHQGWVVPPRKQVAA